ncbi:hypothetical protein A1L58_05145 [Shewanella baltica]|uniref:DUF2971 domain-containing protein n=1 Tax=Shewanella baltica TaxID=62322 RepID=UPI0007B47AD8|nr:DUF2971 domain-containing protein [Shewanella baltica]KZK66797.1 hypothetical protein A1L58_05145 [Shewanella baltica]
MLFKYLPIDRIDVLENLKIRFSPLMSLNDPFECQPLIDMKNERDMLLQQMLFDLNELWENTAIEDKTEENRKILEKTKAELIANVQKKTHSFIVGQELIANLSDNLGVLSLSRTEDNLLMWSHYADEGQGLVIGFDEEHEFFKQESLAGQPTRPIPVVYTNKRSKVVPGEERYYEKLLCEKPRDWAYEEEERLFRAFLSKEGCLGKDAYGADVILTDLPKNAIKAVYLGYYTTEDTKKRVISAIKANEISCNIFQASVSLDEYKIEFRDHVST